MNSVRHSLGGVNLQVCLIPFETDIEMEGWIAIDSSSMITQEGININMMKFLLIGMRNFIRAPDGKTVFASLK
jgi:hypothetical protein